MIKLIILLVVCSSAMVNTCAQQNFTGVWRWTSTNATFDLTISQMSNIITGNHCAVFNNGDKIDCAESDITSLNGFIQGDSIVLTFKSAFSLENGNAFVKKINNTTIE